MEVVVDDLQEIQRELEQAIAGTGLPPSPGESNLGPFGG